MTTKNDDCFGKVVLTYTKDENGDITTRLDVKGFEDYFTKAKSDDSDTKLEGVAHLATVYELGTVAMFQTLNIKGDTLREFFNNASLPEASEDAEDNKE